MHTCFRWGDMVRMWENKKYENSLVDIVCDCSRSNVSGIRLPTVTTHHASPAWERPRGVEAESKVCCLGPYYLNLSFFGKTYVSDAGVRLIGWCGSLGKSPSNSAVAIQQQRQ
jgi:hypothetical protein